MDNLEVNSALDAVGLTGAFANALAEAGLSCNVVAGAMHDHLFVPLNDVERALDRVESSEFGYQCSALLSCPLHYSDGDPVISKGKGLRASRLLILSQLGDHYFAITSKLLHQRRMGGSRRSE